jgi:hypothetical protein
MVLEDGHLYAIEMQKNRDLYAHFLSTDAGMQWDDEYAPRYSDSWDPAVDAHI